MTKGISSEIRKAIPTRTFPEASSAQSAAVDAIRDGGWRGSAAIAAALADELPDPEVPSGIDRVGPALPPDAAGLVEALDDDSAALGQRLRDAEIESVHTRTLIEVLGGEQQRREVELLRLEEQLVELDAEMHLCLARDREGAARAAVRGIIALRRDIAAQRAGIGRIEKERTRLTSIASRQNARFRELLLRASAPLPFDSTARHSSEPPGPAFSSAAPPSAGGRRRPASSRKLPEEAL